MKPHTLWVLTHMRPDIQDVLLCVDSEVQTISSDHSNGFMCVLLDRDCPCRDTREI